ncbi:AT-hook motif nuclear-localized protein 10-like [Forsythia ovata]|uniref:AT-hook motif nuclear-localized protein n=1 Tax=Forsythia ovata TaxID=205694 RepID=A0ABD1WGZ4_9LAMI
MDSQDFSSPPLHPHPQHHHAMSSHPTVLLGGQPQTQLTQPQHNNSYPNSTVTPTNTNVNNTSGMIQHQQNPNPRFPFNSVGAPKPLDHYPDGSPSAGVGGFSIEPSRKKRGRPRKYSPDNSIGLGLSPTPVTQNSSGVVHGNSGGGGGIPSPETPAKRNRGRPPGSVKKQMDALGVPGVGFTPHVITVNAGEDVASKIMAFSQQGPRTQCPGGTVTYEGRFEIISLSGSFLLSENNGNRSRIGGLSVSLAGSDGRVLGGGVAGMLRAASPVQVVVGSFIADGKSSKSGPSSAPPPNMLNFGVPITGGSPSPDGSSDSSEENGGSPLNSGSEPYGNAGQPIQNISMYSNMGWPNSTMKMHPN